MDFDNEHCQTIITAVWEIKKQYIGAEQQDTGLELCPLGLHSSAQADLRLLFYTRVPIPAGWTRQKHLPDGTVCPHYVFFATSAQVSCSLRLHSHVQVQKYTHRQELTVSTPRVTQPATSLCVGRMYHMLLCLRGIAFIYFLYISYCPSYFLIHFQSHFPNSRLTLSKYCYFKNVIALNDSSFISSHNNF